MTKTLFAAAALLCGMIVTSASAEDALDWRGARAHYAVSFRDLDLARQEDRTVMLARIQEASYRLCRTAHPRSARLNCMQQATDTAIARAPERVRTALQNLPRAERFAHR
jgi:UrcA family protein